MSFYILNIQVYACRFWYSLPQLILMIVLCFFIQEESGCGVEVLNLELWIASICEFSAVFLLTVGNL